MISYRGPAHDPCACSEKLFTRVWALPAELRQGLGKMQAPEESLKPQYTRASPVFYLFLQYRMCLLSLELQPPILPRWPFCEGDGPLSAYGGAVCWRTTGKLWVARDANSIVEVRV